MAADGQEMSVSPPTNEESGKRVRKESKWLEHVKKFHKLNGVTFKEALRQAGKSYSKAPRRQRKAKEDYKPNPWMQHIEEFKRITPDWKAKMSYKSLLKECKLTYKPKAD
jgi:ribosomal protein L20